MKEQITLYHGHGYLDKEEKYPYIDISSEEIDIDDKDGDIAVDYG